MFEGIPDQFHQFIASSRASSFPLPLPALHGSSSPNAFPSFDPYSSPQLLLQPTFLHPLHPRSQIHTDEEKQENSTLASMNMEIERADRSTRDADQEILPWSSDEVLALFRIRSTMENWLPDFTWEHVSRKLEELGFKRDAEKCKEKFEEESSRYFNNISYSKNYRPITEFDELYNGENPHLPVEKAQKTEKHSEEADDNMVQNIEEDSRNETEGNFAIEESKKLMENPTKDKKRKRQEKLKIFKSFCEDIVNKFVSQQEEMHNKLIEDMAKREEEFIAREEARKKEEMERINKELELMAHQQAVAGDRQATITEYLKKISEASEKQQCFIARHNEDQPLLKVPNSSVLSASSLAQNPSHPQIDNQNKLEASTSSAAIPAHAKSSASSMSQTLASPKPTCSLEQNPQNPNSLDDQNRNPIAPTSFSMQKGSRIPKSNNMDEIGKRWPRDEVLALINLRCTLSHSKEDKEGTSRVPIWERISQEMLELGYKRSAKRCKEKWENINKYFRKTRDVNKNRSLDSRTCPYFHQLSSLYNSGKLVAASEGQENCSTLPENRPGLPEASFNSSQGGLSESTKDGAGGN